MPSAGAADRESMRLANMIAGNPELSGVLETTLDGPTLRFDFAAHAVVVGAEVALDGRIGFIGCGCGGPGRDAVAGRPGFRVEGIRGGVGRDSGPRAVRELLLGSSLRTRPRTAAGGRRARDRGSRATRVVTAPD